MVSKKCIEFDLLINHTNSLYKRIPKVIQLLPCFWEYFLEILFRYRNPLENWEKISQQATNNHVSSHNISSRKVMMDFETSSYNRTRLSSLPGVMLYFLSCIKQSRVVACFIKTTGAAN